MLDFAIRDIPFIAKSIDTLSPTELAVGVTVVLIMILKGYMSERKRLRNTREHIRSEMVIFKYEMKAEGGEEDKLDQAVTQQLKRIISRLHDAMESYAYNHPQGGFRNVDIIRNKNLTPRPAKEFFGEHHAASKSTILEVAKPWLLSQLSNLNVATLTQETADNDAVCSELVEMIQTGIHIGAGSNTDTRAIEDTVLTFEAMLDIYYNISKTCVLLRVNKEAEVDRVVSENRTSKKNKVKIW